MSGPRQVQAQVRGMIHQTGRRYPALERELNNLSYEALRELQRLLRDREASVQSERSKRRRGQFW